MEKNSNERLSEIQQKEKESNNILAFLKDKENLIEIENKKNKNEIKLNQKKIQKKIF